LNNENKILSLSGGKDSTAMVDMMVRHNEQIAAVVYFDTGWDFPQMINHINFMEKKLDIKIWRLKPRVPFEYIMLHKPIRAKRGPNKGKIHRFGNGWPSYSRRWCTREKVQTIEYFSKSYENPIQYIGYAFDEKGRIKDNSKYIKKYPLIEWGITESDALRYCYDQGYHWDGLYEIFNRVSCYCCPLSRIGELKKLRKYYPELWIKMLEMDSAMPGHNKGFYGYKTVHDLDCRFQFEDENKSIQLKLFTGEKV
jgi:3'-phosphoadenosine 5'-phosphosulfate sulfotransferase (PAPS reductase)/FAD synthetase